MKWAINLDLNKNELQNARIQNLATPPLNPGPGQIYFNTADICYYGWNGTIWIDLGQVLTGVSIVSLINACASLIDDDNLSTNVGDAITKKHAHGNLAILNAMEIAFTTALKTKLDGIAASATKTLNSATNGNININGVEQVVYTHPAGTNPHGTTKSDVGLSVVENKTSATIRSEMTSSNVTTALGYTPVKNSEGLESNRPVATGSGTLYQATDTGKLYKDISSGVWKQMGGQDILPATTTTLGTIKVGANLTIGVDGTLSGNDNPASFIIKQERFPISEGQTSFTLLKGTYKPNTNTLFWYLNGDKQDIDALIETSPTTFSIPSGIVGSNEIMVDYYETINANPYPIHATEHLTTGIDAIPVATITSDGLMPSAQLVKLNGISTGANKVTDSATNGNTVIDGVQTVVYTHPGSGTNPHATTKSDVGLSVVDNTTDANKPVSTAQQTALNLKINTSYIDIDGTLVANSDVKIATQKATKTYVDTKVAALVNTAPAALDTLNELATALGSDPNFATTMATNLGNKVDKTTTVNGHALSGNISVTATDLSLQNVNNTSDAAKPVSTAQATAIGLKLDATHAGTGGTAHADVTTSTDGFMIAADKSKLDGIAASANNYVHPAGTNPHATTKADVGLGNVDNTSDATKPVSTAQATAIALKLDATHVGTGGAVHADVTTTVDGFMTAADKVKMDGITALANRVTDSTTNGNTVINGVETVVYTHPAGTNPHSTTKSDVGLSLVENKTSATIRSEITSANVIASLGYTPGEKVTANIGDGVATSINVTHNLNTLDVLIFVKESIAPYNQVMVDTQGVDVNTIKLLFSVAPTANQYRVVIMG